MFMNNDFGKVLCHNTEVLQRGIPTHTNHTIRITHKAAMPMHGYFVTLPVKRSSRRTARISLYVCLCQVFLNALFRHIVLLSSETRNFETSKFKYMSRSLLRIYSEGDVAL